MKWIYRSASARCIFSESVAPLPSRWYNHFLKQSRPKLRTCNTSQTDPEGSGCSKKKKKKKYSSFFFYFCFPFFFPLLYNLYPNLLPEPLSTCSFWPTILSKNEQNIDNFHSHVLSLTHTSKQTSITPSMNVRWTCDQVIIISPHCPVCL